jgi:tRNA(adenine34) deaminase
MPNDVVGRFTRAGGIRWIMTNPLHDRLMVECLALADEAMRLGEVPIAAVVARGDGAIIGWGWNELNAKRDRTMHAEIAAFRDAAGRCPTDCDDLILASTLEPCIMCAGAAFLCGVRTIVYGLSAPADGGMGRIKPPESPEASTPQVVGPLRAGEVRAKFESWLKLHPEPGPQREFVEQLLKMNHEG